MSKRGFGPPLTKPIGRCASCDRHIYAGSSRYCSAHRAAARNEYLRRQAVSASVAAMCSEERTEARGQPRVSEDEIERPDPRFPKRKKQTEAS